MDQQPAFSIIVATYERPRRLERCLEALKRLKQPTGGFEVVVVNDGGSEPLDGVVAGVGAELRIQLLSTANGGPGAARNAGARASRGGWLAFTDDDCLVDPDWVAVLARSAEESPGCLLGGRTLNLHPENAYACADQVISDAVHAHYSRDGEARFFASNNMAVPRDAFLSMGGFDPEFRPASEDRDLCDRWLASGRRLVQCDATLYHAHRSSLLGFLRQHFDYGRGAARFRRARSARGRPVLAEVARFHGSFLRGVAPQLARQPRRRLRILLLLLAWQLANAAGTLFETLRFAVAARRRLSR